MKNSRDVQWTDYDAVLFDLDGVLTPTAEVHMRAWAEMFAEFLDDPDQPGGGDRSPYTDSDYFAHVDGKPRYDGVRDFLTSRGIELPEGEQEDPSTTSSVMGLGNRKDEAFNKVLRRDGVEAYPGSMRLLDHLRDLEVKLAVVSSSRNAARVLQTAGIADRFAVVVSGEVAAEHDLRGKPAPDTFIHAAEELGTTAARSVVVEDAISGVQAGSAGDFALVVGVDRGAGEKELLDAGADVVVHELDELLTGAGS